MHIGAVLEQFPSLSQTYILWHLAELLRNGNELSILPARMSETTVVHPEVEELQLMRHVIGPPARVPPKALSGYLALGRELMTIVSRSPIELFSVVKYAFEPIVATSYLRALRHLPYTGKAATYDAIHAYFGPSGRRAQLMRELGLLRGPLLVSFLGFDATVLGARYGHRYYRHLFREADCLTVSSRFMMERMLELGAPHEKLTLLPLGLPVSQYEFLPRVLGAGEPLRLLTVGRLSKVKGLTWGMLGVAEARRRGFAVHWTVVGAGTEREHLEELRRRLGLESSVVLHGPAPMQQVKRWMSKAHVCLYCGVRTSEGAEEALGGAVLEAQAAGMPVLATRVGGVPEAFVPGESGVLVEHSSAEAIATGIEEIFSRSSEWKEMGRIGRRHVEERFDCARLNASWLRLYTDLRAA